MNQNPLFRSVDRCSNCNAMIASGDPEVVMANVKLRKADQEHYYCDEKCFRQAMDKASHCIELKIKIFKKDDNHYDVVCKEIKVEFVG